MRYGPNKEIMAIATRWRKTSNNRPIYVEGRKLLEFLNARDKLTGSSKIPGDKILGDESKYSVVCRTFMEIIFEEDDVEKGYNNVFYCFQIQSGVWWGRPPRPCRPETSIGKKAP